MKSSIEVTLPKNHLPVFPDECVDCQCQTNSRSRISQNSVNPLFMFLLPIVLLFGWSKVSFPLCRNCRKKFFAQRWGRFAVYMILIATGLAILNPYISELTWLSRRFSLLVLLGLTLLPLIILEMIWPKIFSTTATRKTVEYQFASCDYALKFSRLNLDHVISSNRTGEDPEVVESAPSKDEGLGT